MDGKRILNGMFTFKRLSDGSLDKSKVVCELCYCELSYHRSTSSLRYHLKAKHTAEAHCPPPRPRRASMDVLTQTYMDTSTKRKLTEAIAKWVATACRPANVVEDQGLVDIIRIASNDWTYEMPTRATISTHVHKWYDTGKTGAVALSEDHCEDAMPGPSTRPAMAFKRELRYSGSQQVSGCKFPGSCPKRTKASDASEDSEDISDDMRSYMAPVDSDSDEADCRNTNQAPGEFRPQNSGHRNATEIAAPLTSVQATIPVKKEAEIIRAVVSGPDFNLSEPSEINESDPDPVLPPSRPPAPGSPRFSSVIPASPARSPPQPTAAAGPGRDAVSFWKVCNEAGKTQAIFSHFSATMQGMASRIQMEQASPQECDVALKVMEISGELEFQRIEIEKKMDRLKRAADAMTRAISAAKK